MVYFHLLIPIGLSTYGFMFNMNKFDYFYILFVFTLLFHWTLLNSECMITYFKKKKKDPLYIAGKDALNTDFKDKCKGVKSITFLVNIAISTNTYIVITRNDSKWFAISFIVFYFSYFYSVPFFTNHHINPTFHLFQNGIKYLLIVWASIFTHHTYQKIYPVDCVPLYSLE